jgi:uncharacterized GH25 family protein
MRIKKSLLALILLAAATAEAHDLFLKLETYFVQPESKAVVRLLNGTFKASDGLVARERMRNISVLSPHGDKAGAEAVGWRDEKQTTIMEIQTGKPGTYVAGVSTYPKEIALKAADFNEYLAHDGIPDMLAARRKAGQLHRDARERYSKHVRAVFQVGDAVSDDFQRSLNYPVEIIPQQNPYTLSVGQSLTVRCLLESQPLVNQFVMAGWENRAGKLQQLTTRTDQDGFARIKLAGPGKWYVKFIHMRPLSEPGLDYESKWATLTFQIKSDGRKMVGN